MKFWEDEDDIEGPTELYSIKTTVDLNRDWSFSAGNDLIYGRLIPEIYEDNLFFINSLGNVISLDFSTGNKLWNRETNDIVSSGVDVNFKTITYSTLDGFLVALNYKNGEEIWRSETSSEGLAPPANSGTHIVLQTVDGRISGYDSKSGELEWFHQTVLPSLTLRGNFYSFYQSRFYFYGFCKW
jgi:outer membrane protein assembly factor BamB